MLDRKEYTKFLISMVIFGTNGLLVTNINLSSVEIVLTRTILGGLVLLAIVLFTKDFPWQELKRSALLLIVAGVVLGLNWVFLFEAYRYASVSIGVLIYYCGPIIVMLLSPFLFGERLGNNKIAAIISVAIGMICITGIGAVTGDMTRGILSAILAAVLYASVIICNKFIKGISGVFSTLIQLISAFCVLFVYLLIAQGGFSRMPVGSELVYILILGIINSGLACYLYFSSMQKLPGQTVALSSYLDPLTALLVSALFLGERLSALQLVGAVLILGGALIGELRFRRKNTLEPVSE